jgi:hypothetical protein
MPTTSASLYEQLFALTTVMKQRVVDNFSGDSLNERWTQWNETGTGTFAMSDEVDGGFSIITDATSGRSGIGFNNIRQYSNSGLVVIAVIKRVSASNARTAVGAKNTQDFGAQIQGIQIQNHSGSTYYIIQSGDASTGSSTNMTTSVDTSWHNLKQELGGSDLKAYLDGTLEATHTTNLPTTKMQPLFASRSDASSNAVESRIRYMECYNT